MHQSYACPYCTGELHNMGNVWECGSCKQTFPANYNYYNQPPPMAPYPPAYGYPPPYYPNPEIQGLIPNRYDLLFYTGIGVYILLFFSFIFTRGNIVVYSLMCISISIPIFAIYLDFKNSVRSTTGTIGNICAIIWIAGQIIITILMGLFALSGTFQI